jgi:hypothetical protein
MELTLPIAKRLDKLIAYLIENSKKSKNPWFDWYVINLKDFIEYENLNLTPEQLKNEIIIGLNQCNQNLLPMVFKNGGVSKTDTTQYFYDNNSFVRIYIWKKAKSVWVIVLGLAAIISVPIIASNIQCNKSQTQAQSQQDTTINKVKLDTSNK